MVISDDSIWINVGSLAGYIQFAPGDKVNLRFYNIDGELSPLSESIEVTEEFAHDGIVLPFVAAQAFNEVLEHARIGVMDHTNAILANYGENNIYVDKSTGIIRAEVELCAA